MKELDIFTAALAIADLAERDAFLNAVCPDPAVKAHMLALLEAEAGLGGFLEAPALPVRLPEFVECPGAVIGPYKLLEEIGEGGMGAVFLAEQEKPVRRQVALKVIKPGMDTRQVVARFEAERQALALMEHPNIARVLDAGTTVSGRPYFVMELVRGVPITAYCAENRLNAGQRLRIFVAVCHAIQHAHQKGVIHRDIKPSNVLVTLQDGQPVAKVIDFGIAKAVEQRLTEKTFFTTHGQLIGTPEYMSPEQAAMNGIDVDTRSDIYSLGVLLYELMTGSTPLDPARLREAGFAEILRLIREESPTLPSERTTAIGDPATTLAGNREADPKRGARRPAGDLDWIMMKALEKDRDRRYPTPDSLAEDVERYLRGEAILARPPSALYRLARFVRRNRGAVLAVSIVVFALALGTAVATWQAITATRARKAAEASEAEARAVLGFVEDRIFSAPRPEGRHGGLGPGVTLRETLESALPSLETDFAQQPLVEARLRLTLGHSFWYLGDAQRAADQYGAARAIYAKLDAAHPRILESTTGLANGLASLGQHAAACELHEEVLARRTAIQGPYHRDTLTSMQNLASSYFAAGQRERGLELHERTLKLQEEKLGAEDLDTLTSLHTIAGCYLLFGRTTDGLKLAERAFAQRKRKLGPKHPDTLSTMDTLGSAYAVVHRAKDALDTREKSAALHRETLGPTHPDTLASLGNLASSYSSADREDEALRLRVEVLAAYRKRFDVAHPDTLRSMSNLALSYRTAGRLPEAIALYREVLQVRRGMLGPAHPDTLLSMGTLASSLATIDDWAEAIPLIDECVRGSAGKAVAPGMIPALLELRLRHFRGANDPEGCRATAELWEAQKRSDADSFLRAARFRAVTARVLRAYDPSMEGIRRADAEVGHAMEWLRRAVDAGVADADDIETNEDLSILKDRADFRELITRLEAARK